MEKGYEIFQPSWPLTQLKGCANKHWTEDLLLISRTFLTRLQEEGLVIKRLKRYEIKE